MFKNPILTPLVFAIFLVNPGFGQTADSTNGWLYNYDSLLQDIPRWQSSPHVRIDSIGASVQNRALWMVSITDGSETGKQRVFVHARTHPGEVQAFYVAREMMKFLLDTSASADSIRRAFVFHFLPMYNPDGVELGYARLNANRVDLEGNWNSPTPEPEVLALRAKFIELMGQANPVRVALNLHSDRFNCTRFFFYHEAAGTSAAYAALEQEYITGVRSFFPQGMETWDFVRSWAAGTPTQYPESFWWLNYRESVMALTYEDANCPTASDYDLTARALVLGSVAYVQAHPNSVRLAKAQLFPRASGAYAGPVFLILREGKMERVDLKGRRYFEMGR